MTCAEMLSFVTKDWGILKCIDGQANVYLGTTFKPRIAWSSFGVFLRETGLS